MWLLLFIAIFGLNAAVGLYIVWHHHRWDQGRRGVFIVHPSADGGGGGEKCLWAMIASLTESATTPTTITLFCHLQVPQPQELLKTVKRHFRVQINPPDIQAPDKDSIHLSKQTTLRIVRLQSSSLLDRKFTKATRLLQLLAGIPVGLEAALRSEGCGSDEIWDTVGLASTVATFSLVTSCLRKRAFCYIHWPFTDRTVLKRSQFLSVQWWYDALVLTLYYLCGHVYTKPIVSNSTYTSRRVNDLWGLKGERETTTIYPPVDLTLKDEDFSVKENVVMSIAQFRPEKDHRLQISIIRSLIFDEETPERFTVKICGSLRPLTNDVCYFLDLMDFADEELPLDRCSLTLIWHDKRLKRPEWTSRYVRSQGFHHVEFHVNASSSEIHKMLASAKVTDRVLSRRINIQVGLHTMKEEHFGISVVDMLCHEVRVVAHASGGPLLDILRDLSAEERELLKLSGCCRLGWLEGSKKEFVSRLAYCMTTDEREDASIARRLCYIRFKDSKQFGQAIMDGWGLKFKY